MAYNNARHLRDIESSLTSNVAGSNAIPSSLRPHGAVSHRSINGFIADLDVRSCLSSNLFCILEYFGLDCLSIGPHFEHKPQVRRSALQSGSTGLEFRSHQSSSVMHIHNCTQGLNPGISRGRCGF